MKRKLAIVAGIAAVAMAVYMGRLWGQGSGAASPRPTSKIAVVNLPLVIKNYKKFSTYEKELEAVVKKYQIEEETLKKQLMQIKADLQSPSATTNRDTLEQKGKDLNRKLEDLSQEFKKEFGKKQEAQLVQLYQEVENMVKRVAVSRGFEMVLQYSDAVNPKDAYNPMIIQRKVVPGVCMPMYAAEGLDVSKQVYDALNYYYDHPQGGGSTR